MKWSLNIKCHKFSIHYNQTLIFEGQKKLHCNLTPTDPTCVTSLEDANVHYCDEDDYESCSLYHARGPHNCVATSVYLNVLHVRRILLCIRIE